MYLTLSETKERALPETRSTHVYEVHLKLHLLSEDPNHIICYVKENPQGLYL